MKTRKVRFAAAALALALSVVAVPQSSRATSSDDAATAQAQGQYGALERGYRTGYSDGYQAGWRDSVERRASDYRSSEEYRSADRAYIAAYGALEDYRDGYRQGFESGYEEGYNKRGFNSELPAGGVRRRGVGEVGEGSDAGASARRDEDDEEDRSASRSPRRDDDDDEIVNTSRPPRRGDDDGTLRRNESGSAGSISGAIPSDTFLRIELLNRLSTDVSQRGDRFEARVVEPSEYAGAVVTGRVADVQRSGRVGGRSELQLDFDGIQTPDGDRADFRAQVVEVVETGGVETGVDDVDDEGSIRGKGTTKDDVVKVGAAAGVGAIIGGIIGGGKGAGIGAAIGGGAAGGRVLTQRGKDIILEQGQQLRIRTSGTSRIN
ncbi:MAG TPA: hypothetical protein VFX96_17075 [Pyrinomonadaceae bacterium]|nr:hypothetical protein [Pyrinomonadaceae bacterium]